MLNTDLFLSFRDLSIDIIIRGFNFSFFKKYFLDGNKNIIIWGNIYSDPGIPLGIKVVFQAA